MVLDSNKPIAVLPHRDQLLLELLRSLLNRLKLIPRARGSRHGAVIGSDCAPARILDAFRDVEQVPEHVVLKNIHVDIKCTAELADQIITTANKLAFRVVVQMTVDLAPQFLHRRRRFRRTSHDHWFISNHIQLASRLLRNPGRGRPRTFLIATSKSSKPSPR